MSQRQTARAASLRPRARAVKSKSIAPEAAPASLQPGPLIGFLRLLWQVHHGLQSASKRMERELGVTGPQRLVVRLLGDSPGMTAGELASLLHLDPGTMSGVVAGLLRARLIRRAADPIDRRRFLLALTPAGKLLALRKEHTVEERVELALRELGPADIGSAEKALSVLATKLLGDERAASFG